MDVGGYATGDVRGMGAGGSVGNRRRTQRAQLPVANSSRITDSGTVLDSKIKGEGNR